MSVSTATGQHNRPDMLVVTLIHQPLRIDAARLASALATVGPGDRPGRAAIATTAGSTGRSPAPLDGLGSRKTSQPLRGGNR